MRLFLLYLGILVIGVTALTACNSNEFKNARAVPTAPQSSAPPMADGTRRVTIAELKAMFDRNEAFVVDVRTQQAYDMAHIRGSKLIPEGEILNHLDQLPSNKLIVTYCSCPNEHTSGLAVAALRSKGVNNAAALLGGFQGWQAAGHPVEGNTSPATTVQ